MGSETTLDGTYSHILVNSHIPDILELGSGGYLRVHVGGIRWYLLGGTHNGLNPTARA